MKLLLDVNMPRQVGNRLAAWGHEWQHADEIGMAEATDAAILDEAALRGGTVLRTTSTSAGRLPSERRGRPRW